MKRQTDQSSDYIIFKELIHEYDVVVKDEVEKKIKRKLKYYKLGLYDQARVDYIRSLRKALGDEIHAYKESKYYKKTTSIYAEIDDFNIEQMVNDYQPKFAQLSITDLRDMIGWAVHMLYTR